jgi:hypothetical protein
MPSLLLLLVLSAADAAAVTPFSAAEGSRPPEPWRLLTIRNQRPSQFDVVEQDGHRVLMVYSANAGASLSHPLDLDPDRYRTLVWRWRVDELPASGELGRRNRDDHAARLCVSFRPGSGEGERGRAFFGLFGETVQPVELCYAWDNRQPVGHVTAHATSERIGLLVLQSGEANARRWIDENRDLLADYRSYFDGEPARITGITLSSGTTNTGERALAWFGDIRLEAGD